VNAALKQYVADGSWAAALRITVAPSGYNLPAPPTPGAA
jgi:glutamate transport system substrate-binding protein